MQRSRPSVSVDDEVGQCDVVMREGAFQPSSLVLVPRVPGVLEGVRGPIAREVTSKAGDERVAYVSQEPDFLLIVVSLREGALHQPLTPVSHRSNQQGGVVYGVSDGRSCCVLATVPVPHPLIVEDVGLPANSTSLLVSHRAGVSPVGVVNRPGGWSTDRVAIAAVSSMSAMAVGVLVVGDGGEAPGPAGCGDPVVL